MVSTRERLPSRRQGLSFDIGRGSDLVHVSTGVYEDGRLGEIFLDSSREGTFTRDILNALAIAISVALQHGTPLATLQHSYKNFNMQPDFIRELFKELAEHYV